MTKPLSPTAQAVLDAVGALYEEDIPEDRCIMAATLRAAAEIVAPLSYEEVWTDGRMLQYEKGDPVRNKLFAIADELKVQ